MHIANLGARPIRMVHACYKQLQSVNATIAHEARSGLLAASDAWMGVVNYLL